MALESSPEHSQDEARTEAEVLDELPQYVIDQLPTEDEVEARDHDAGIERGALVSLLTPPSKVRILQTLITMQGEKANPTRICEKAGVGRSSWYNCVDDLQLFGVIEQVDAAGNSPLYRVDMDDEIIERLFAVMKLASQRRAHAQNEGSSDPEGE